MQRMKNCKWFSSIILVVFLAHISNGTNEEGSEKVMRQKRSLDGRRLKITTILAEPYTMRKGDGTLEGFVPDLVETLSRNLRFKYDLYLVPDGRYGMRDEDGNWNGMIKEVLDHENDPSSGADIAAAPITVTSTRLEVINYIKPFQHTGLAVLVKKAHMEEDVQRSPVVFQVLGPFSAGVWALAIAGFILVSLLLWIMNLKNPYEWKSLYEIGKASENQGHLFNLPGAFWFTFSTLQWQGYEQAPRSIAARVLSCFWFGFVTLTLVTYTGSLMNYLFWASTIHARDTRAPPFHTLEELLLNTEYSYGVVKGGSTYRYITSNQNRLEYKRMTQHFQSPEGQKNLVRSTEEGIERARNGKFAFIMEDMSARHHVNQAPCDLMVSGEKFAPRAYGMVVSKQMPQDISEAFHHGIMELYEMGEIESLENKWWIDRGECWNVTKEDRSTAAKYELNKPKKVTMSEFWGPFVLLLVGVLVSIVVAVAETFYYRLRGRYQGQNTPGRSPLKSENGNIQA